METSWLCEDAIVGVVIDSLLGVLCGRPLVLVFDGWDVADRGEEPAVVPPVDPAEGGELDVVDGRATGLAGGSARPCRSALMVSAMALS